MAPGRLELLSSLKAPRQALLLQKRLELIPQTSSAKKTSKKIQRHREHLSLGTENCSSKGTVLILISERKDQTTCLLVPKASGLLLIKENMHLRRIKLLRVKLIKGLEQAL